LLFTTEMKMNWIRTHNTTSRTPRKTTLLCARFTSHLEAMVARRQPRPRLAAKARFKVEDQGVSPHGDRSRLWVQKTVKGRVSVARVAHKGRGRRNHHKICGRIFTRGSTMHLQDVA
jgi:hypothetical protein